MLALCWEPDSSVRSDEGLSLVASLYLFTQLIRPNFLLLPHTYAALEFPNNRNPSFQLSFEKLKPKLNTTANRSEGGHHH